MHWWRLLPAIAVIAFIVWAGIKLTQATEKYNPWRTVRTWYESE